MTWWKKGGVLWEPREKLKKTQTTQILERSQMIEMQLGTWRVGNITFRYKFKPGTLNWVCHSLSHIASHFMTRHELWCHIITLDGNGSRGNRSKKKWERRCDSYFWWEKFRSETTLSGTPTWPPPRASLTGQTLSFTHLLFKIGFLTLEMTRRYISLFLAMMSYLCHLSYGKIEYEWRRGGIGWIGKRLAHWRRAGEVGVP